jgi:transposase
VEPQKNYSKEFKDVIVQKLMNRGHLSIRDVCEREGLKKSTVHNWLIARGRVTGMKKSVEEKKWSAEAKLKSLNETSALGELELGLYLRREGLYGHQLTEWRKDVLKSLDGERARPQGPRRDERDERIKELERDLLRMEKALAEASARMMLEKKADLFWANREAAKK